MRHAQLSDQSFPCQYGLTRGFTLGSPRDLRVSADGERVVFLRSSGPTDAVNSLWCFDVRTGTERLVVDAAPLATQLNTDLTDLSAAEQSRRERARELGGGIVAYDADADLNVAVFVAGSRLVRVDLHSGELRVLDAAQGAFDPRLSPDGLKLAYLAGRELRVLVDDQDRSLIGEDTATISWGAAEFIAAEEMGRSRGFWWAADSSALLVAKVDVSPVDKWWMMSPNKPWDAPRELRYPRAGRANALVTLAIISLADRLVEVDWRSAQPPHNAAQWEYLAGAQWCQEGILLTVQSRDQRRVGVLDVDPVSGDCQLRYEISDEYWVELVAGVPTLHDGRLVTVEDRGFARRLCVDGKALTGDAVQVRSVLKVHDAGIVIAACTEPTSVNVATLNWDGELSWWENGANTVAGDGVASAILGGATEVRVKRSLAFDGAQVEVWRSGRVQGRISGRNAAPGISLNISMHRLGKRELATALLLPNTVPPNSTEATEATEATGAKLPVLLDPYGGPHAQRVLRSRSMFYVAQWFADQGFAVVVTDGRGTPGRGPKFEREVWGDLAGPVLEDQIDALYALAEIDSRLDLDRVAIRGWSFGGYLAALAVLRRPDVFSAAIAGAPVTDWRLYDTHYTERYLGHPEHNPQNYQRSNVLFGAKCPVDVDIDKVPSLLLIHGLADDNVVAAHTLRLSQALLEAGYSHQVLPLPGVSHMTPQEKVAENLLVLQSQFLQEALTRATPQWPTSVTMHNFNLTDLA